MAASDIALVSQTSSVLPRELRPHKELLLAWMLLLLDGGETYGYKLHQELLARQINLQPSSMYRWLGRLERDQWVASRWSEPVDGPRRHVYFLTPQGRSELRGITGLISTMRDIYSTFVHAHAQAVALRIDSADVVGDAAIAVPRADPADAKAGTLSARSTQQPLRPHRELVAGWLLLHLDVGATYGYDVRREFQAHGLSPDPAAMYRMLRRMEADRWVQSRWMSPVAGPRRRFYRLTTRGRRNLDEIARLIATIRDSHDSYLQAYQRAVHGRDEGSPNSSTPSP